MSSPYEILRAALKEERRLVTHKQPGHETIYCRTRHDTPHGWHLPGEHSENEHFGSGVTLIACQNCRTYARITLALLKAGLDEVSDG